MNHCSSQGSLGPGKQHSFSKPLQQVSDQVTLRTQAPDSTPQQSLDKALASSHTLWYPRPKLSPTQALTCLPSLLGA